MPGTFTVKTAEDLVLLRDDMVRELRTIILPSVEGKWVACHDTFGHHYKLTGTDIVVDSVTTQHIVDKPHLPKWAAKVAVQKLIDHLEISGYQRETITPELVQACTLAYADVRDDAGALGADAHDILEVYANIWIDTGRRPDDIRQIAAEMKVTDPRVIAAARSGEAAYRKYPVRPVVTEIIVGDAEVQMAGALDVLVWNLAENTLEMWDYKSSNNVSDTYAMQVASYHKMFEKMTGLVVARSRLLKLDKTSDRFEMYDIPDIDKAYQAQLDNNALNRWLKNGQEKLVKEKTVIVL